MLTGPYVDGVSLTVGSPAQHLFTWAVANTDLGTVIAADVCPCAGGTAAPSFVENAFRCESGSFNTPAVQAWFTTDPVFDGFELNPSDASCAAEGSGAPAIVRRPQNVVSTAPLAFRLVRTGSDEDIGLTRLTVEVR